MKTEDIIDSIGRIDDDLIKEAASIRSGIKRKQRFNWQPVVTAAACMLIIGGAAFALRDKLRTEPINPPASSASDNPADPEPKTKTIEFGGYNWIVLEENDGKALVISENVLEDREYWPENDHPIPWQLCFVRGYLGNEFLRSFSSDDQKRIIQTHVANSDDDTDDRIFLLSAEEVRKYFADDSDRTANYANGNAASWWLRSSEKVGVNGEITQGEDLTVPAGVRPAMWIYLNPEDAETAFNDALKPFGLLGDYKIADGGEILIKYPDTNIVYEPDTFRKYFFGTWKREDNGENMIIDDSEKCTNGIMLRPSVYWVSDHVIAVAFTNGGCGDTYWIDVNEPDKMYHVSDVGGYDEEYDTAGNIMWQPYCQTFTKTDAPINEPENGYISYLRLAEITREYDMSSYLFTDIKYEEKHGINIYRDDYYFDRPIYMISMETDQFVFKTSAHGEITTTLEDGSSYTLFEKEVDITVTLKKIGDEWERSLEFGDGINELREAGEKTIEQLMREKDKREGRETS